MANNNKKASSVKTFSDPFLEALRDLGRGTAQTAKDELVGGIAKDFFPEMLGLKPQAKVTRGDLRPGESVSFQQKQETELEMERMKRQLFYERSLQREVQVVVEEDKQQLQVKIQAIRQEIVALGKSVVQLEKATKEAVMVAPVEPGVYHESFFEKLKNFLIEFRKSIESAADWMTTANARAQKKQMRFWGKYKSQGSKFFLSSEHYLTRSAG